MYDYRFENRRVIFFIDTKSFYASVEAIEHGYHPMKVPLVVVSQGRNVGGEGLVLATSPMAKKMYRLQTNVSRMRDLHDLSGLIKVPPRMNLYIKKNLEINDVYRNYVAEEDLHPYSIDESILDLTDSWRLFGATPWEVARKIQLDVHQKTGLYTTVGIGDNPTLAKLALDVYAKHSHAFIGEIHFETVPDLIWPITDFETVWSIGKKTAKKLNQLGLKTMYDLAHINPFKLREKFGPQNGLRLYALAWGIDRTMIREKVKSEHRSIGNSQILPKNYVNAQEIEIVIKEITEQIAARLRFNNVLAGKITISIGNKYLNIGFNKSQKIVTPTNSTKELQQYTVTLFKKYWQQEVIRNIAIYASELISVTSQQLDIFDDLQTSQKQATLDKTVDAIRQKYGFTKLIHTASLSPGATAIERANLVGGHSGGNAYE